MTQESDELLPCPGDLAKEVAQVRTVGVGRPLRQSASVDGLVAVARELATDPSRPPIALIEDAIRGVIERHGKGKLGRAIALEFGADETTEEAKSLQERRRLTATELGISQDTLKKSYDDRMCQAIAEDLLRQLVELRDKLSEAVKEKGLPAVDAQGTSQQLPQARHRLRISVGISVAVAVLLPSAVGVWLLSRPVVKFSSATRVLPVLISEANRALDLNDTPVPGTASGVLGFGDSVGGRIVYPFVPEAPTTNRPFFNSMVDVSNTSSESERYDPTDQRMFVHAASVSLNEVPTLQERIIKPQYPYEFISLRTEQLPPLVARVVTLTTSEVLLVSVYIANDAWQRHDNCNDARKPWIAHNSRLRIAVWESQDRRLHVIRVWLDADNTYPRWVTDAIAAVTTVPTDLTLDRTRSEDPAVDLFPPKHQPPPFSDPLQTSGMLIGEEGLVGNCSLPTQRLVLAFK